MRRFRIALVASVATLALGGIAVPLSLASSSTTVSPTIHKVPALDTIHVHGQAMNGKKFKGHFAIQRYVPKGKKVYAVGKLTGTLNGRHVTKQDVSMPAKLTKHSKSAAQAAASSCTVLHLQLGPINLNLLGLRVQLFGGTNPSKPLPITLLITAVPGKGNLLGNLLCDLTGALNPTGVLGQLAGNKSQLAATLTSLTSLLGAL